MALRQRSKPLAEEVLEPALEEANPLEDPPVRLFLPTGCALLNCCLSDRADGGWPAGRISNLVGDTDTAKSLLSWQSLAEAAQNPAFDDYELIFIDRESAVDPAGIGPMFGESLADRVKLLSPLYEDKENQPPETVEEFHYFLLDLFESRRPFICVLDSLDDLPSKDELEKTEECRTAHKKGKETTGSYQMSKQKYLKKMFREINPEIMKTENILIVVSQTIANIGSMFSAKARAGGSGLDFSSRIIMWLSVLESDKEPTTKEVIGKRIQCKISKNHITHKRRNVPFWVYDGLGVDDIKTSIDFLTKSLAWSKAGGWIIPEGLWGSGETQKFQTKELIKAIERDNLENEVARLVQKAWAKRENLLQPDRKRRYQ
jgi:RecA/RadA recombinase